MKKARTILRNVRYNDPVIDSIQQRYQAYSGANPG